MIIENLVSNYYKNHKFMVIVYILIVLQDVNIEGARNGDACHADYLLIPGGHCKVKQLHSKNILLPHSPPLGPVRGHPCREI